MAFLDIPNAQTSLQNHLPPPTLRARLLPRCQACKAISTPFALADDVRLLSMWKSFLPPVRSLTYRRRHFLIKAVATAEPKTLVSSEGRHGDQAHCDTRPDLASTPSTSQNDFDSAESTELDDVEKMRRLRISKANSGRVPWNKGRKHSPETIQRIKEKTRLAMQDPKIKLKLANLGHAQSTETRVKISIGVRMKWERRREKLVLQETCYFDWQNLIAEASRMGYVDEEELEWNSYDIISEKLEIEWLQSVENRKLMPRPKGSKRAPKTPEQKKRIAEAIAAKWHDPLYRERVLSGKAKFHGSRVGTEKKPRQKPREKPIGSGPSTKRKIVKKKAIESSNSPGKDATSVVRQRNTTEPSYKDPSVRTKLRMIMQIRKERAAAETQKTEAIERARFFIAEAEKAAKVLEVAAAESPVARASLLETRKLIDEAIQSFQSVDGGYIDMEGKETDDGGVSGSTEAEAVKVVNGTKTEVPFANDRDLINFTSLAIHGNYGSSHDKFDLTSSVEEPNVCNGELNGTFKSGFSSIQPNGSKAEQLNEQRPHETASGTRKKRWVRGKLVDVVASEGSPM